MLGSGRWSRRSRLTALAIATLMTALSGAIPAVAASPTPSGSASASSTSAPKAAPVDPAKLNTYGIGPASAKKIDGRASFAFFASPGATAADHVGILNVSAHPLTLSVYATDAVASSGGSISYQPRSFKSVDAGSWLHLKTPSGTSSLTIAARTTMILPFTLDVPANASPGDHTAGLAVSLAGALSGPSTKNATFDQAVVTEVAVRVSGPIHAAMAVTKLNASYHGTVNPVGAGSVTVSYVVRNTGNVNLTGRQKVTISGIFGAKPAAVANVPLLLPGGSEPVSVQVPNVWPQLLIKGKVQVTPVAVAGEVDPPLVTSSASTTIWAVPWSGLAILLIIMLLVLAWWWLSHRSPRTSAHSRAASSRSHRSRSRRSRPVGEATQ